MGQVLLRLFVLQFSMAVAAGHLGSLRKLPGRSHAWFVVRAILYPFSPILELLWDAVRLSRDRKQRPGNGALYVLNCIAGAPAVYQSTVICPLIQVDEHNAYLRAEIELERYSWKWVGRFVLLIAGF
jgi:hypothetical protein